jgi:hypothetical protein
VRCVSRVESDCLVCEGRGRPISVRDPQVRRTVIPRCTGCRSKCSIISAQVENRQSGHKGDRGDGDADSQRAAGSTARPPFTCPARPQRKRKRKRKRKRARARARASTRSQHHIILLPINDMHAYTNWLWAGCLRKSPEFKRTNLL